MDITIDNTANMMKTIIESTFELTNDFVVIHSFHWSHNLTFMTVQSKCRILLKTNLKKKIIEIRSPVNLFVFQSVKFMCLQKPQEEMIRCYVEFINNRHNFIYFWF